MRNETQHQQEFANVGFHYVLSDTLTLTFNPTYHYSYNLNLYLFWRSRIICLSIKFLSTPITLHYRYIVSIPVEGSWFGKFRYVVVYSGPKGFPSPLRGVGLESTTFDFSFTNTEKVSIPVEGSRFGKLTNVFTRRSQGDCFHPR